MAEAGNFEKISFFADTPVIGEFPTGLFGCCSVKDCGVGCCVKMFFCGPCNYGSAMEKAELGYARPLFRDPSVGPAASAASAS